MVSVVQQISVFSDLVMSFCRNGHVMNPFIELDAEPQMISAPLTVDG